MLCRIQCLHEFCCMFFLVVYIYRVRQNKTTPKKTYISRERYNLNYSNSQILLPRNTAWYSESFIHIPGQKQKLSLSKLKSAILQLNTRYYYDCYTENANKTNCVELIWQDEYPRNSSDLNPLAYQVWDAMLDMYQRYTPKPTLSQGLN